MSLASNTNTSTRDPTAKKRGRRARASMSSVEIVEITKVVPKTQGSPKKRARVVDDSSDFEVVESANASKPHPGSPDYALQSPITITAKTASVKSVARKLSFGDILPVKDETTMNEPLAMTEKRIHKPSQKAKDAAETGHALSDNPEDAPRPAPRLRRKVKENRPSKDVAVKKSFQSSSIAPLDVVSSDKELPFPILTKAPAGVKDSYVPDSGSASNQSESLSDPELSDTAPAGKLMSDANGASKEWTPDTAKNSEDAGNCPENSALLEPCSIKIEPDTAPEGRGSNAPPAPKADGPAPAAGRRSVDNEDVSSDGSEMDESASASDSSEVSDPGSPELAALHELYPDLPKLKTLAILKPYRRLQQAMGDESDGQLLSYDAIFASMDKDAHARLLHRAQNFVSHSFYANPARADMNSFRIDKSQVVHRQLGANAVFVITGAVAECHLQTGAKHGFGEGYQLKKLMLYPFDKNHDRTISFLGSVANFEEVSTHWVDSSLMFSTRKDGSNASGSSPMKKSSFFVSSAPTTTSAVRYPGSLGFSNSMPIYDGRKTPFKFKPDDFDNIKKLPLWHNGKQDLPLFAIVAVGFTFNTFNILMNETSASFNIMFAIYLGVAKEKTFI